MAFVDIVIIGVVDIGIGIGIGIGISQRETKQVSGMPDGLRGRRSGKPSSESAFGVGPEMGVGGFGAEEPGLAGHEEEVVDRGEGGEVEGVVGEERLS